MKQFVLMLGAVLMTCSFASDASQREDQIRYSEIWRDTYRALLSSWACETAAQLVKELHGLGVVLTGEDRQMMMRHCGVYQFESTKALSWWKEDLEPYTPFPRTVPSGIPLPEQENFHQECQEGAYRYPVDDEAVERALYRAGNAEDAYWQTAREAKHFQCSHRALTKARDFAARGNDPAANRWFFEAWTQRSTAADFAWAVRRLAGKGRIFFEEAGEEDWKVEDRGSLQQEIIAAAILDYPPAYLLAAGILAADGGRHALAICFLMRARDWAERTSDVQLHRSAEARLMDLSAAATPKDIEAGRASAADEMSGCGGGPDYRHVAELGHHIRSDVETRQRFLLGRVDKVPDENRR